MIASYHTIRWRSDQPPIGWIRNASASRKPTWIERVGRLESGAYAAMTSWYVENASAIAATMRAFQPVRIRFAPVSSNSAASGFASVPGSIFVCLGYLMTPTSR
jgi:hypothetical protein